MGSASSRCRPPCYSQRSTPQWAADRDQPSIGRQNTVVGFTAPGGGPLTPRSLKTLPLRAVRRAGGVIKYGFMLREPFITWLEEHMDALLALEPTTILTAEAIRRSCGEGCRGGRRRARSDVHATLNLDYTLGVAIRDPARVTASGFATKRVGAGTVMALEMSHRIAGWLQALAPRRDHRYPSAARAGLPVCTASQMTAEDFMEHMAIDEECSMTACRLVFAAGTWECHWSPVDFPMRSWTRPCAPTIGALTDQLGDE